MGNSFIFPVPKCSYTAASLDPFYIQIPVTPPAASKQDLSGSQTSRKNKNFVPALYIKSSTQRSKYLFIYTHGNSEDLGRLYYGLLDYYERFEIDVLAPEYPGYGLSKGKVSAQNMVQDTEQAILYATSPNGLGYDIKDVILIGRSIGTGVAVEIAAKYPNIRGTVLISAFLSIRDVAQHVAGAISKLFVGDIFKNILLIDKIRCPILFIHGKKDELIPFWHSSRLYEKAQCNKKLVLSEGMDHNRAKVESDIYRPIESFLLDDLQIKDAKGLAYQDSRLGEFTCDIPEFLRADSAPLEREKKMVKAKKLSMQSHHESSQTASSSINSEGDRHTEETTSQGNHHEKFEEEKCTTIEN